MTAISDSRKSRGRPKTGIGKSVGLRLYPGLAAEVEVWRAKQKDSPSLPEALRRLIEAGLNAEPRAQAKRAKP
jgi:hypothetical protein